MRVAGLCGEGHDVLSWEEPGLDGLWLPGPAGPAPAPTLGSLQLQRGKVGSQRAWGAPWGVAGLDHPRVGQGRVYFPCATSGQGLGPWQTQARNQNAVL